MPRRSAAVELAAPSVSEPGKFLRTLYTFCTWCFAAVVLCGLIWGAYAVEQFVVTDKRFVLQGPPEPGLPSEYFTISGAVHSSEQQITNVFARDFGRSIYLCPIQERRRRLLAIDWVRDATVSRVWPNRIEVLIREREPVAFVQIPAADGTMVFGLVDAEGVMLDPQRASRLGLPVLSGISLREKESTRRERVRRFLRLQSEMGPALDKISEIDVSDIDNLKVVQVMDGRALTLMLGNQNYLQRYQNFTENYPEIRKRLPNAVVLDLRLKDRITAVASTDASDHSKQKQPANKEPRR